MAEKLADDLTGNRLWEGEFNEAASQIKKYAASLPDEKGRW
jgi:hypothetical protein